HAPGQSQRRRLEVEIDVRDKNNRAGEHDRERFAAKKQRGLNLGSSPGSGKTTLLTETLTRLKGRADCAVNEGHPLYTSDAGDG
ncbi:hydrogenase nickel incorporation protein HypB, partial [Escherichia coli]|nr:hydrogenase nickel incorporation protein HypB [Escherichia coli]